MQSAHEPSVHELRRQSEIARAELAATLRDLRQRFSSTTTDVQSLLSPSHVKDEVKSYAREAGDGLYRRVESRIRRNPLQAAAVGAGLAYPLWSLVRRMPVPLMLLGAGFWVAGRSGRKSAPHPVSANASQGTLPDAGRTVTDAPSIVSDLGAGLQHSLERTAAAASEKLDQAATAASDRFSAISQGVSAAASGASQAATNAADSGRSMAADAMQRSRHSAARFIDQNPVLVAGLGLGVGAVLAALIPATRADRRVLAPVRARLQEEASAAAANGVRRARSAVDGKLQDLSDDLDQEGLGPAGLGDRAAQLTESASAIAERGLEAALGDTPADRRGADGSGEQR
jgi:hypothetical protein